MPTCVEASRTERAVRRVAPRSLARAAALALALLAPAAAAQKAPSVSARVDPMTVKLGATAALVVVVENAQGGEIPSLPSVDGLRLGPVGSPALASFTEIVNGRVSSQVSLTWRIGVQPQRAGEFLIPPFAVRADGRELTTPELRLLAAEDFRGDELGILEIEAPREVFQGEPFTIEIRVGMETGIQGRLNRYDLALPWLGQLGGLVELGDVAVPAARSAGKILLNARAELEVESLGTRQVGPANFYVLRARKRFVATRPGTLTFPASHFEFGYRSGGFARLVGGSTEDFSYFKRASEFALVVKPIPEAGRPLDWSGAVGRFEAAAIPDRRDVVAGDSIKLTVEWTGEGNLEFFDAPDLARLEAFAPFQVYGTTERRTASRRAVTYDLAPLDAATSEIPPVPLVVFDTTAGRYATVETRPIPIRVRPLAGATGLPDLSPTSTTTPDLRDIRTRPAHDGEPPAPSGGALLVGGAATLAGWLALRAHVRRRGDPAAPLARARRRARRDLERALRAARTPEEQVRAVHAFLAARSGETPEAWAGRDPVQWARAADAPRLRADVALDLRALLARLDAAIWGGASDTGRVDAREVLTLADRVAAGGL
ncbi:MAG: BatD family protein [Planctomycetes bacterium]|nr:BatD family protein [Planctomycetota bacterium]